MWFYMNQIKFLQDNYYWLGAQNKIESFFKKKISPQTHKICKKKITYKANDKKIFKKLPTK